MLLNHEIHGYERGLHQYTTSRIHLTQQLNGNKLYRIVKEKCICKVQVLSIVIKIKQRN